MSEDQATPPQHPHHDAPAALPEGAGIGTLGVTLIGSAVAAAVGLLVAIPLIRRQKNEPKATPKTSPPARRPQRRKPTDQRP
jgi:hypothetical protein